MFLYLKINLATELTGVRVLDRSIHIGGVAGLLVFDFEEPEHRRPFQHAIRPARLRKIEHFGARKHILWRNKKIGLCRHLI
jgi:hypothetical protein